MKRIYVAIFALLFVAGCYFFPYSADIVSEKYSASKLQQDFTVFRTVLEKAHPGLYTYTDKQEMDACFDSIYKTLVIPVDMRAFHQKLSFIIDQIGCSHTNLYLPKTYYDTILRRSNFFPVPVIYVDGGLYINSDTWNIPVGAHIISINGNSAEQIMKRIVDYNVPDGRNKNYNLSQGAVEFAYDYFLAYGPCINFQVEYAMPGSTKNERTNIPAVTLEKHLSEYNYNSYYNYSSEVGYDFEVIDSVHTAVLTLRSFAYGTSATFAAYKNFLINSFTLLKNESGINNLIIDCRNNIGGEYENIFLLYRFLSKNAFKEVDSATVRFDKTPYTRFLDPDFAMNERLSLDSMVKTEFCRLPNGNNSMKDDENNLRRPHPMAFNGKVFIITNNNVLSAASNFVAMIKDSKRGTIVGEETGGGYNSHNGFTRLLYKLPNTGLLLEFSAVKVQHYLEHPQLNKYGIEPDYPVSNTLLDIIENQDPQMSFIMDNLIKNDR
ncbi:MAG TPA: S41 family peptidase [Chitinophagaceae bacterium]|nr:S41 family peptidase [Chitinophagaceae bacterium]